MAYGNSLWGPFVFDDIASIPGNPTLPHLGSALALHPAKSGTTVDGRPLLNLSFALNYAWGGLSVTGYHVTNICIHALCGLFLFALVRRTAPRAGLYVAGTGALLWLLHPLQTESVTYIVQRAESLAALFSLATLYAFARFAGTSVPSKRWGVAALGCCVLGLACKETAAATPFLVLLYDRTFCSGTFARCWSRHRGLYLSFGLALLCLAGVVFEGASRGGTAGPGLGLRAVAIYAQAQPAAIVHYLRLAFWPFPLVFDYGTHWATQDGAAIPCVLAVAVMLIAVVAALRHAPKVGFFGGAFFLLLAPSSSIVPIATERMAEHRMYLPLAALTAGAAIGVQRCLGQRGLAFLVTASVASGCLTAARNLDYSSSLRLWADTVTKQPDNPSARVNLGYSFLEARRYPEAIVQFDGALALEPDDAKAHNHRGRARSSLGDFSAARSDFEAALRLSPDYAEAHNNLGVLFAITGDRPAAVAEFKAALQLAPEYPEARANLTRALGAP